jgi:hypothetical protein
MIRLYGRRVRGQSVTFGVLVPARFFVGVTVWRRGAVSLLAPVGRTGVPVQVVFGDWWRPSA